MFESFSDCFKEDITLYKNKTSYFNNLSEEEFVRFYKPLRQRAQQRELEFFSVLAPSLNNTSKSIQQAVVSFEAEQFSENLAQLKEQGWNFEKRREFFCDYCGICFNFFKDFKGDWLRIFLGNFSKYITQSTVVFLYPHVPKNQQVVLIDIFLENFPLDPEAFKALIEAVPQIVEDHISKTLSIMTGVENLLFLINLLVKENKIKGALRLLLECDASLVTLDTLKGIFGLFRKADHKHKELFKLCIFKYSHLITNLSELSFFFPWFFTHDQEIGKKFQGLVKNQEDLKIAVQIFGVKFLKTNPELIQYIEDIEFLKTCFPQFFEVGDQVWLLQQAHHLVINPEDWIFFLEQLMSFKDRVVNLIDWIKFNRRDIFNSEIFSAYLERSTFSIDLKTEPPEEGPLVENKLTRLATTIGMECLTSEEEFTLNSWGELIWNEINLSILLAHSDFTQIVLPKDFIISCHDYILKHSEAKLGEVFEPHRESAFEEDDQGLYFIHRVCILIYVSENYQFINHLLRGRDLSRFLTPEAGPFSISKEDLKCYFLIVLILSDALKILHHNPSDQPTQLSRKQTRPFPQEVFSARGVYSTTKALEDRFGGYVFHLDLPFTPKSFGNMSVHHETAFAHGTLFRVNRIDYCKGEPVRAYASYHRSPNYQPDHHGNYLVKLALRYAHEKYLGQYYYEHTIIPRANHDTRHVLRTLFYLDYILKYFTKHISNKALGDMFEDISKEDLTWVKLVLVFFVTGRNDESHALANPQGYSASKQRARENFFQFLNKQECRLEIVPSMKEDLETREKMLEFISSDRIPSEYLQATLKESPRYFVMLALIHMAHCLDLGRCYKREAYHEAVSLKFRTFISQSPEQETDLEILKSLAFGAIEKTRHHQFPLSPAKIEEDLEEYFLIYPKEIFLEEVKNTPNFPADPDLSKSDIDFFLKLGKKIF